MSSLAFFLTARSSCLSDGPRFTPALVGSPAAPGLATGFFFFGGWTSAAAMGLSKPFLGSSGGSFS
uniref:Uncharacterized protein n=1 Tax=Arundo donax TaxID=35708 RepID=A0A0A9FG84_ARUDO